MQTVCEDSFSGRSNNISRSSTCRQYRRAIVVEAAITEDAATLADNSRMSTVVAEITQHAEALADSMRILAYAVNATITQHAEALTYSTTILVVV